MTKKIILFALIGALLFCSCWAYTRNPYITDEAWEQVTPYLLPEKHRLRKKLDQIFSASRVTASQEAMLAAGFLFTEKQGGHVTVAVHPELPGIVVKMYTDDNATTDEWKYWVKRIKGMLLIKKGISDLGYKSYFTVPQKWIYPLPAEPSPPEEYIAYRKNFVLIAEDMNLLPWTENKLKWRYDTDKKRLYALYQMQKTYGLNDSMRIHNIPWSSNGKIVFVDTETYMRFPVNYHPLLEFLCTALKPYWREITGLKKTTQ